MSALPPEEVIARTLPQVNARELEVFAVVAETCNLSEAGRILYMHTSTVSKVVSRLEHRLKLDLLVRTSCGVQLTPAGRAVLPAVELALDALGNLACEGSVYRAVRDS